MTLQWTALQVVPVGDAVDRVLAHADVRRLEVDEPRQLHPLRRWSARDELPDGYLASLVGTHALARSQGGTPGSGTIEITWEQIDAALADPGPKFYPGIEGLASPAELLLFIQRAAADLVDGTNHWWTSKVGDSPALKFAFEISLSIPVGTASSLPLGDRRLTEPGVFTELVQPRVSEEDLKKLPGDFRFLEASGLPQPRTNIIGVILAAVNGRVFVLTTYPGKVDQPYPYSHFSEAQRALSSGFWERNVGVPFNPQIGREPRE